MYLILYALQEPPIFHSKTSFLFQKYTPVSLNSPQKLVHLTGFVPFMDVEENPSELVAQVLNNTIIDFGDIDKDIHPVSIFSSVLDVTAEAVSNFTQHEDAIAIVHMGYFEPENGMRLEIIAANVLSEGNDGDPIIEGGPQLLPTTVDLSRCFQDTPDYIQEENRDTDNEFYDADFVNYHEQFMAKWHFSRNAGEYFCNEIFYRTTYRTRMENTTDVNGDRLKQDTIEKQLIPVIFVHLPPLDAIPLEKQAYFVYQVLQEIVASII